MSDHAGHFFIHSHGKEEQQSCERADLFFKGN